MVAATSKAAHLPKMKPESLTKAQQAKQQDELLDSLMSGAPAALGHKRSRMLRGEGSNPKELEGKQVRSCKQVCSQMGEFSSHWQTSALSSRGVDYSHSSHCIAARSSSATQRFPHSTRSSSSSSSTSSSSSRSSSRSAPHHQ